MNCRLIYRANSIVSRVSPSKYILTILINCEIKEDACTLYSVYKPFNTVSKCTIGLICIQLRRLIDFQTFIFNCMKGIIYSRYLPVTVWKGSYTVLSILYMYTLECIQGLWDICILRFLMKDKICYPSKLTFSLWLFSLSLYHSVNQSISKSVNQ